MMVRTPWKHALKHFTSKYQPRPRAFCEIHTRSTCKPTLRGPKTTFPYRRVTRAQKRCICCTSFGDDPGVLTPRAPHPRATRGSLLFSRYRTPGASHRQPQRTMAVYAGTRRRRRSPPRGQAGPGRWALVTRRGSPCRGAERTCAGRGRAPGRPRTTRRAAARAAGRTGPSTGRSRTPRGSGAAGPWRGRAASAPPTRRRSRRTWPGARRTR